MFPVIMLASKCLFCVVSYALREMYLEQVGGATVRRTRTRNPQVGDGPSLSMRAGNELEGTLLEVRHPSPTQEAR